MGRKTSGLYKRGQYWFIDKQIFGRRIRESSGATSYSEAQAILARRIEETRQAKIFGVRPKRTFKEARLKAGRKSKTVNHDLKIVRHLLNLAASEWMDENGLTWLAAAPKIKLLPENDVRPAYPLSWE